MLRIIKNTTVTHLTIFSFSCLAMHTSVSAIPAEKSNFSAQEQVYRTIAARLNISTTTARFVVEQSKKGSTVPFLARYRRDETGNLDETVLRQLLDMSEELSEVHRRRTFMLKSLKERGLLTDEIKQAFERLVHLNQLEDAWEPFKEKKTSLSHRGREAGLEPLTNKLLFTTEPISDLSERLRCIPDGGKLFQAIIVEEVQRCDEVRRLMLSECRQSDTIHSTLIANPRKKAAKEISADAFNILKKQFSAYEDRRWPVQRISGHNVLALQRGESKGVLTVKMIPHNRTKGVFFSWARQKFIGTQRKGMPTISRILDQCLEAAYEHILKSTHTTIRRDLKKSAEKEAIAVFAHSLRHILLQCPMRDARLLAMDPGITNGVKCVALDEHGMVLTRFKCAVMDEPKMKDYISSCVGKLNLNKIVIGNGTASRKVADIVADTIEERGLNVEYAIVSEAGASVYSVSDVAKEEFPTLDPMYRGAVNIGRRVIDPLSELAKIPVRSMGIGMYQHDMSETELLRALNRVVESCVTCVGVNAMITNRYVMEKIPGVTKRMVDQIILARHAKKLKSREDLRRVPGMTEAVYQQIAGFFRFPNSPNPLDNSNIHPESYDTVEKLMQIYKGKDKKEVGNILLQMTEVEIGNVASRIGCGKATLELVAKELASPALDPRSELPHAGLFRRSPRKASDLKIGDKLTGVVQSVTTFGVFVDVGLHDNVLVRGVNIDTVHAGSLLDDLRVEGFDQLNRLRVRYDGNVHAINKTSSSSSRSQGPAIESEDILSLVPIGSSVEPLSLSDSLAVVRGEQQQLFAPFSANSRRRPRENDNNDNGGRDDSSPLTDATHKPKRQRKEADQEVGTRNISTTTAIISSATPAPEITETTIKRKTKREISETRKAEGTQQRKRWVAAPLRTPTAVEDKSGVIGDEESWWRGERLLNTVKVAVRPGDAGEPSNSLSSSSFPTKNDEEDIVYYL
ncbi:hypothetical protein LSM04_004585 [Trypanosoma melophagium]|uniref:uncharacterized protein n=1 Tax=Trypanosoma melophagium TaxID=715481 RepID=UPI00351A20A5|nr:hypothetical protein LSM04_004585 [Trypanosoma melophagium]